MEVLLSYHRHLVEGWILVMLINTLLPHWMVKKSFSAMVFYSRLGFFLFWMLWSMVAFSGLITLVFTKMALSLNIWLMIILIFILPLADIIRARALHKKYWSKSLNGIKFSNIVTVSEMLLVVLVMVISMK